MDKRIHNLMIYIKSDFFKIVGTNIILFFIATFLFGMIIENPKHEFALGITAIIYIFGIFWFTISEYEKFYFQVKKVNADIRFIHIFNTLFSVLCIKFATAFPYAGVYYRNQMPTSGFSFYSAISLGLYSMAIVLLCLTIHAFSTQYMSEEKALNMFFIYCLPLLIYPALIIELTVGYREFIDLGAETRTLIWNMHSVFFSDNNKLNAFGGILYSIGPVIAALLGLVAIISVFGLIGEYTEKTNITPGKFWGVIGTVLLISIIATSSAKDLEGMAIFISIIAIFITIPLALGHAIGSAVQGTAKIAGKASSSVLKSVGVSEKNANAAGQILGGLAAGYMASSIKNTINSADTYVDNEEHVTVEIKEGVNPDQIVIDDYYRNDGTHVRSHNRTMPNETKADNIRPNG